MDMVKLLKDLTNHQTKISLYQVCFAAIESIKNSAEGFLDSKSHQVDLITKPNQFYAEGNQNRKNEILHEIANILSEYDDKNRYSTYEIEKILFNAKLIKHYW